ncbi:conjugal transfer protein TraF [Marinomonas rhizomae]|uniref:conjugal transfer protein TraF n=1 Tax=Marinomonas rhizomae TaxID=491948 RepID=UPI0021076CC0|nr:conjugal transfer protein TraF [Marinomonas rhizomae]UTW00478.1 conjugal transfer protein TraF [Marinomonas rhizomae]
MKKLLLVSSSLLSTAVLSATPVYLPTGSSFTLGSSVNQRSLSTSLNNPAAPFLMVNGTDDYFRFGIVGPIGIGIEMGDVSDLEDRVDEVQDLVDSLSATDIESIKTEVINSGISEALLDEIQSATSKEQLEAIARREQGNIEVKIEGVIRDKIDSAVLRANNILAGISDSAYVKAMVSAQVPFMPLIYKTRDKGAFTIDSSISAAVKGNLIEGTIKNVDNEFESTASFYTQAATDFNIGFGYSRAMWKNSNGVLIGGAKANVHKITLGRSLVALTDDSIDAGDAISDTISDDGVSSTGVGIDLGAVWSANYYQVGLTVANINEPEFDGAALGQNCGTSLSCKTAAILKDEKSLSRNGDYTMEMQSTIDAAITSKNRQWTLAGSYDVNSVNDPVGDEYQWGVASLSYYGDSHFLPGLRVGLRKNMAGTELSYATFGLTIVKRLNIDVAVALDSVENEDGDEVPRSAYFSIGYDTAF